MKRNKYNPTQKTKANPSKQNIPGSLVIADHVKYIVQTVITEDCNKPDLGCDSYKKISKTKILRSFKIQETLEKQKLHKE